MQYRTNIRNLRINLKVTQDVHSFLEAEAELRGVAISALCAHVVGEWRSNLLNSRVVITESSLSEKLVR